MRYLSFVLAVTFAVTACGSSSSPTTPAAAENASPTATTSVINGTVAGGSSAALASTNGTNNGAGAGMTVTVEGTSLTATVNGAGQFVLSSVPAGAIVLRFTGAGANAQLNLGSIPAGTTLTINVIVSGSTAALQQKTVNGDTEIEGLIESVAGSTLRVAGRTVLVTPSTTIRHGGTAMTLAQLAVGQRVHVKGSTTGTGSSATTTAATIVVQNDKAEDDEADDDEFEAKGPVSSLTGACPAITFTLGGKTFRTNSSTQFKGGACSAIANGATVEAEGTMQADGSVLAKKVESDKDADEDEREWEAHGAISGLTGSCPAIAFTLGGKTVRTNSSTQFKGGTCSAIANGATVEAEGTVQADGSVLAKKVESDKDEVDDADEREWEAHGAVSGLTGSCPAIAFTLGGKTVRTNSSTEFKGGACSAIANGATVEAEGTVQADGSVLAKKIKRG